MEFVRGEGGERRGMAVQVVQRPGGGIVRGVGMSPVDTVPRGSTVLSSGRQSEVPVNLDEFARIVPLLAGPSPTADKLLETGIKVIDVMCPLVVRGSVAIIGEARVGIVVVTEELIQRLSGGPGRGSLFSLVALMPNLAPNGSFSDVLEKEAGN